MYIKYIERCLRNQAVLGVLARLSLLEYTGSISVNALHYITLVCFLVPGLCRTKAGCFNTKNVLSKLELFSPAGS